MGKAISSVLLIAALLIRLGGAFAEASTDTIGIRWTRGITWDQVRAIAKSERKYIFLDCFATWCGPCKAMDRDVYGNRGVGDYFNDKFISVKVQMDKTNTDDDEVKEWYGVTESITKRYKITGYPTFLFFSPSGEIVYKAEGYKSAKDLIAMGMIAHTSAHRYVDPYAEYDNLVEKYREGKDIYYRMPYVINVSKKLNDKNLADSLRQDYYRYLANFSRGDLFKRSIIEFIAKDIQSSDGKYFGMFYPDGRRVDAVMHKSGYASTVVDRVIKREIIEPFKTAFLRHNSIKSIQGGAEPDWSALFDMIQHTYNTAYARRGVRSGQVDFYWLTGNKRGFIRSFLQQLENNDLNTAQNVTYAMTNAWAWDVFEVCHDKDTIDSAIHYMKSVLRRKALIEDLDGTPMDTYANLLYKLSMVHGARQFDEAIRWEEKALGYAIKREMVGSNSLAKQCEDVITKMKNKVPTWKIDGVATTRSKGITEKASIDSVSIEHWPSLGGSRDLSFSDDGLYFAYSLYNPKYQNKVMMVGSADGHFRKEFPGGGDVSFSANSKEFAIQLHDTLCFISIGKSDPEYIKGVSSWREPSLQRGEWIAWQLKGKDEDLYLRNRLTGKELHYRGVNKYEFDNAGTVLLLEKMKRVSDKDSVFLRWVTLANVEEKEIYSGSDVSVASMKFDGHGTQLVFVISEGDNLTNNSVWYYKQGMQSAILKATNRSFGVEKGLTIQPSATFNDAGTYIYISMQRPERRRPDPDAAKVNIWNYQDAELQSLQLHQPQVKTYTAVTTADEDIVKGLIVLNNGIEDVSLPKAGDFALVTNYRIERGDRFWLDEGRSNWLVSLRDGSRRLLKEAKDNYLFFSPSGRYLVYYDSVSECYMSYDLIAGKLSNISSGIPKGGLTYKSDFNFVDRKVAAGYFGWLDHDAGLLVSDNNDIWLLDPNGEKSAFNITNGYGRQHHIKFGILPVAIRIPGSASLLLSAYNTQTKYNGFFRGSLSKGGDPELLTMGPYIYYFHPSIGFSAFEEHMEPVKAANVNSWIVKRCSFDEAPNLYLTRDFKTYKPLTDIEPQAGYNWLTAELVKFKQLDGTTSQGILYKPEDFDSKKKYPVLINYHDQNSQHLYDYPEPDFTGDAFINIPWFVSRGYLVFLPDIYFNKLLPGPAGYNTVVAAAQHLSKAPYIDNRRIGIAGHSYGGGITNYLVTHTGLFAAAFEGAGVSDLVSSSLELGGNGGSRLGRGGSATTSAYPSLWKRPDIWIHDSPIFSADKVSSPLLMFHCRPDGAVPWEQAVEFFIALRRLDKKVWLVEYDNGNHEVFGENARDLTVRVTQFFDHYLRGLPAPVWMTRGIPASLKQIDTGFELDRQNSHAGGE